MKCLTSEVQLRRLEYFWGIKPGKLNLDSTRNTLCLRSDNRISFDEGQWALIPAESVLKIILDSLRRNISLKKQPLPYQEEFPDQIWEYEFRPLQDYPWNSIFRRIWSEEDVEPHDNRFSTRQGPMPAYQTFHPPFANFPLLKSHVHPFFVIFNAARKLLSCGLLPQQYQQTAEMVINIYFRWMNVSIPKLVQRDVPEHSTLGSTTDEGTKPRSESSGPRTRRSRKRKRETDDRDEVAQSTRIIKKTGGKRTKKRQAKLGPPRISLSSTPEPGHVLPAGEIARRTASSIIRAETETDQDGAHPPSPTISFWDTVPNWVDQSNTAIANGDITSSVGNKSRESRKYKRELVRQPPPETSWAKWNVEWANYRGVVDPRTFGRGWSSNDWARWWMDTLLPHEVSSD